MLKNYLVLFPGAWGNRDENTVYWWFQVVIAFFSELLGDRLVVKAMVYGHPTKRRHLNDYAQDCLQQLDAYPIPAGSRVIAAGYSMGSQVLRLVASKRPDLFTDFLIFNGSSRFGTRTLSFLQAARLNPWVMLRGLWTGEVVLDEQDIYKLFFAPQTEDESLRRLTHDAFMNSHPESFWVCVLMNIWLLRQKTPALPGEVHFLVSDDDVLYGVEADKRGRHGETWNLVRLPGGHGSILDREVIFQALGSIFLSD